LSWAPSREHEAYQKESKTKRKVLATHETWPIRTPVFKAARSGMELRASVEPPRPCPVVTLERLGACKNKSEKETIGQQKEEQNGEIT
jgi:hypothetical protein